MVFSSDKQRKKVMMELSQSNDLSHLVERKNYECIDDKLPNKDRKMIAQEFIDKSRMIDRQVSTDISEYKPLGVMSEIGDVLGVQPKRGIKLSTPLGNIVFAKNRLPSKEVIDKWYKLSEKAKKLRDEGSEYIFDGLEFREGTTTGNYRVVEHAKRLKEKGLLKPVELINLKLLEKAWDEHPEVDKQKGTFVFKNGKLEAWKPSWSK